MDNRPEFSGGFAQLCWKLKIAHHCITVGNSKANGQIKRLFRIVKVVVCKGMTADPNSYWSNHVLMAEMLLWFTRHQAHGLVPFMVITGRHPVLPIVLASDHG